MINKIYKRIHNKYSTLFKFIFFLRHLFAIFFASIVIFLSVPYFFDLNKKDATIKNHLLNSYGLKLNNYENIKYNFLPTPNLNIQNANISIGSDSLTINVGNLIMYPKLLNIYNNEDFKAKKIILNKNNILLDISDFKILINYIYNLKNKLTFKKLDLQINRKNKFLTKIKEIDYSNYGFSKGIIKGKLFNKKFKILLSENSKKINFKFLKTGITADINFNEIKKDSVISGFFRTKLLNSKLKFNFEYDGKKLKIYNSYFRNKYLSFNNHSTITYTPFFIAKSVFNIDDINKDFLKIVDYKKILASKYFLKKINAENEINFKSKKFSKYFINDLKLNVNLAYGKLVYSKKILTSGNIFSCQGSVNLLEDNPILFFNCLITGEDKKSFLKQFNIKYANKNQAFKISTTGNINILKNKINFKDIKITKDYELAKEDLNYVKQAFETIIFEKGLSGIFNFKKIKEFILEIY